MEMVILETPMIVIPADPKVLARLIYQGSTDWGEVLKFFKSYCSSQRIPLDVEAVKHEIYKMMGE